MKSVRALVLFCLLALAAPPALAQLPGVGGRLGGPLQIPTPLGGGGLPGRLTGQVGDAVNGGVDTLRAVKSQTVDRLVRANRGVLERDPAGQAIMRNEVFAIAPSADALARAAAAGFSVEKRSALPGLGLEVVILKPPTSLSTRGALERLHQLDPAGAYDYNHLYFGSGPVGAEPSEAPSRSISRSGSRPTVGMIDGGVEASHPALAGARIVQKSFVAASVAPSAHGTAVASLIAGRGANFVGAAPGAALFVADVFEPALGAGSAEAIARGFSWLVEQHVPVINASIVGPANQTLAVVVRAAQTRGAMIVAAVGNDGPAAPPLYPASYPGVVGVTAVDARRRVLVEAARGDQVDLAARARTLRRRHRAEAMLKCGALRLPRPSLPACSLRKSPRAKAIPSSVSLHVRSISARREWTKRLDAVLSDPSCGAIPTPRRPRTPVFLSDHREIAIVELVFPASGRMQTQLEDRA